MKWQPTIDTLLREACPSILYRIRTEILGDSQRPELLRRFLNGNQSKALGPIKGVSDNHIGIFSPPKPFEPLLSFPGQGCGREAQMVFWKPETGKILRRCDLMQSSCRPHCISI